MPTIHKFRDRPDSVDSLQSTLSDWLDDMSESAAAKHLEDRDTVVFDISPASSTANYRRQGEWAS